MRNTTAIRLLVICGMAALLMASFSVFTATPGEVAVAPPTTPQPNLTPTPITPTVTDTPIPPTVTNTPVPPTATNTPVPPTATQTRTPIPPTATNTPSSPPPAATSTTIPPGRVVTQYNPNQGGLIDGFKEGVQVTLPPGLSDIPLSFVYQVTQPPAGTPSAVGARVYFTLEAFDNSGNKVTKFKAGFQICAKNATGLTFFDGQKWVDLPVTPSADGVCATLDHLTLFAVVVTATPTPAPAGGPGVAGPGSTTDATVVPTATTVPARPAAMATTGIVPTSLPSTGGATPMLPLLIVAIAALALGLGLALRRSTRA